MTEQDTTDKKAGMAKRRSSDRTRKKKNQWANNLNDSDSIKNRDKIRRTGTSLNHTPLLITEILMTLALVLFIAFCLKDGVRDDVAFSELEPVLLQEVSDPSHMQKEGAMKLRSLYGLTENEYQEVSLYIPASNMDAQEMLLIHCRDASQTQEVEEAMRSRVDYNISIFESYGVEQMGIINRAVVETKGLYCLYICDSNSDQVQNVFEKMLKK